VQQFRCGFTLILTSILLCLISCGSDTSENARAKAGGRPPVAVEVASVELRELADTFETVGTLTANESVVITASVTDYVSSVNFEDGQFVRKGDVLVNLTNDEQHAELQEARANLSESERQLKRLESIGNNLASRSEIDIAKASVEANRGRLKAIDARLKDRIVRAPFSGVLSFRRISVGSLVSPGTEITQLQDISTLNLDFSVPEVLLGKLKTDSVVEGFSPSLPEETFNGKISFVDNQIDPATRSVLVRAKVPNLNGYLRPGMLISVALPLDRQTALVIPESALQQIGSRSSVYIVDEQSAVMKKDVLVNRRIPGSVIIDSGIQEGDKVVTLGTISLRPGAKVKIVKDHSGTATGVVEAQK
jgi:membrane fusion protein (multidrug efflux system)